MSGGPAVETPEEHESPIRVVVADDSAPARRALTALLRTCRGHVVVGEAGDGEEAVALVEALRPDVVLMDLRMPGMDGIEATRIVKTVWPEVAVLAVTMHADLAGEARGAGADGVLLKGFAASRLTDAIRMARTGRRRGGVS
jgi:DNA-binding NarL/FixJ family response regulator